MASLSGQADHRDDIIKDVANADPEGPAPEELAVDLPAKPHAPVVKMTCAADVIPRTSGMALAWPRSPGDAHTLCR